MGHETHWGAREPALRHDIGHDYRFVPIDRGASQGEASVAWDCPEQRPQVAATRSMSCTTVPVSWQTARELDVAIARPGNAPALAATLGCMQASLEALAQCIDSARARIHEQLTRNRLQGSPAARSALADLEVLRQELDQACRAARTARRAVGRLVAEAEPA
jgi:hypothetical protein